jgi:hypothetical protein
MRKMKKRIILTMFFLSLLTTNFAQKLVSNNVALEEAYQLAVNTVKINTRRGVISAGAQYGSEWTRDIAINVWNGATLLSPKVAEKSLWSATHHKTTIGHQYWDKIIWIEGAWQHYLLTGDQAFLQQAYQCGLKTMTQLEDSVYDAKYKLFTGPSVFNDGIAGYEAPVYDAKNNSSFVLDHKHAAAIKCLSTNAIYYLSYLNLNKMHVALYGREMPSLLAKASTLKAAIRQHFYDASRHKLYYLIDHIGKIHKFQEALGISFAILSGIVNGEEALAITQNTYKSSLGIPSIYPNFKRFSDKKPGRHNNLIWPMVNGFYADAAMKAGNTSDFDREFEGLMHLALDADKGNYDFYEIYRSDNGKTFGGWQCKHTWESLLHQTWSATAFMRMIYYNILGMKIDEKGLTFAPYLPASISYLKIEGLQYRGKWLTVELKGKGSTVKSLTTEQKSYAPGAYINEQGSAIKVSIEME